jgi:hypothetical protein
MKLNEQDPNFIHYKSFSFLYPEIDFNEFEDLRCENCMRFIGKYYVSDPHGLIVICQECLDQDKG